MSNRRANMELQAGSLAQSTLEQLRAEPFANVASAAFDPITIEGITYNTSVNVSDVATAGDPPEQISQRVRVTVQWSWSDRQYATFRETILCRSLRS